MITLTFLLTSIITNVNIDAKAERSVSSLNEVSNGYLPVNYTYEWPMFHHDLSHTGYTESDAPDTNNVLWTFTTMVAEISVSPMVVDGRLFIPANDNNVYALDATNGSLIWNFTVLGASPSPEGGYFYGLAVADGKVFFGSSNHNFYAVSEKNGSFLWNFTTGHWGFSNPVVANNRVFFGSGDHKIYCLEGNTGRMIWNYTTGHCVYTTPAVVDNKVYFGSYDFNTYCLNTNNGSLLWNYTAGSYIISSPTIMDDKVYFGSIDDCVYCVDADNGSLIWKTQLLGDIYHSPVVAYERIYVGAASKDLFYCLDAKNGAVLWDCRWIFDSYPVGYVSGLGPAIADGKVYFGTVGYGYLFCLDAFTGDLLWDYIPYPSHWAIISSPAIAYNKLYVGMYDYNVYCFGLSTENPTASVEAVSTNFTVEGKNITFTGHGNDTDSKIIKYCWESNIDGFLSSKPSFTTNKLSVGNHTITFKVLDSDGEWSDEVVVNVTVRSNDKPVIDDIGDLVAWEDELFSFQVNATDPDNDNITFYDDSDLFEIDSTTGLISFIPTNDDVGTYNITITVIDEWDAEEQINFTLTVENVNDRPVIDWWDPMADEVVINETENITFSITASDIDVGDTLSYEWYVEGVLKGTNVSFNFTSDYNSSGVYEIKVVVTDNGDTPLNDTCTWILTVLNKNRKPIPIISSPLDNTNFTTNDNIVFDGSNTTDPDDDNLTFLWLSNLSGHIGNKSKFNTTLPVGIHSITLIVNDSYTESSTTITLVINKPPSEPGGWFEREEAKLAIFVAVGVIGLVIIAVWAFKKH